MAADVNPDADVRLVVGWCPIKWEFKSWQFLYAVKHRLDTDTHEMQFGFMPGRGMIEANFYFFI